MAKFRKNTLQQFTQLIDSKVDGWTFDEDLGREAVRARDGLSEEDLALLRLEHMAICSRVERSKLKSPVSYWTDEGEICEEFLSNLTDIEYDYIRLRAESTTNLYLRVKYNLALWHGPRHVKHQSFATKAIDTLIEMVKGQILEFKNVKAFVNYLDCAADLSGQVRKYRGQEIEKIGIGWAKAVDDDVLSAECLVGFVMEYPKIWPAASLNWAYPLLQKRIVELIPNHGILVVDGIAHLGSRLAQCLKKDPSWWYEQAGECHEGFDANRMGDPTNAGKQAQYRLAMEWYTRAGNQEKLERAKRKYEAMRAEIKMTTFQWHLPEEYSTILGGYIHSRLTALHHQSLVEALDFFATDTFHLPTSKLESKQQADQLKVFTMLEIDGNHNVNETKEETDLDREIKRFLWSLGLQHLPLFMTYCSESITSRELTRITLLKWFKTHTLYGKHLSENDGTGVGKKYNWMESISPAIEAFFLQKRKKRPNYAAAIDSLTLKVEGILREIATRHATTTRLKDGKIQEMLFDPLLNELANVLKPEDMLFIKAVFTSKGMNLRNKVAHCFLRGEEYGEREFYLVLWALMRLGKYEV
jgi:hypothetical protein